MIYTVGHKENYLKSFKDYGRLIKVGRQANYTGGIVFRTREAAEKFIEEAYPNRGFAVFSVDAKWEEDTYPQEESRFLTRDADIIIEKEED